MTKIMPHHLHFPPPGTLNEPKQSSSADFKQALQKAESGIQLSKHAAKRMQERDISISSETWRTMDQKLSEAEQKGVTDSVVITADAALVVNTASRTVITAVERGESTGSIFSNINGTIIL
ncbi:TIGR02530 family flagellar biosynthesis protein [Alkalicoccus luteus]|uniref:Flagellar operon protein n=1 Tax=Alkalicoccus luteus TaxID=1237094 RepID=A0A969PQZ7_9BACI|nr:TIGR02530 family flagellar biosynthesis protein [Alkalicoccus luteus]NJP36348.1 hypothetical protein [Alkalicoccus luteus]